MSAIRVEGALDPTMAWDGRRFYEDGSSPTDDEVMQLRGGASWVLEEDAGRWLILRDPLGINKLFWVQDEGGSIVFAARPRRLIDVGYQFEQIKSVPPGTAAYLPPPSMIERSLVPNRWFETTTGEDESIEGIGSRIRTSLTSYLEALASTVGSRRVFVCLSGGLDSSGIAALAREVFSDAVAVSFDIKRPGAAPSDDRVAGERVAKHLGMPVMEASVTEDELLGKLDSVLVEGVDWRDFNVHAALVNAVLADAIAAVAETAIVLTGDLANEFLIDYEPEEYGDTIYYRLPRLRPAALRTSLVRGLDTCHREVGIFAARGLRLVQPYAVAVDSYLSLSEDFLERGDRKSSLGRAIFGTRVPESVYARKKTRAQVGSASGAGVLGLCLDRGIDPPWLQRRFCRLHGIDDVTELGRFMRGGRYRSGIPAFTER